MGHVVGAYDFGGLFDDGGAVDGVDVGGSGLDGEHGEDSGAASYVEDDLWMMMRMIVCACYGACVSYVVYFVCLY